MRSWLGFHATAAAPDGNDDARGAHDGAIPPAPRRL